MDMFDMHLAEKMSGNKRSISELLYDSLVKTIDPSAGTTVPSGDVGSLSKGDRQTMPLSLERLEVDSRPSRPAIPVKVRPLRALDRTAVTESPVQDSIVTRFGDIIEDAAVANKIDSALICAVIKTESGGNPRAVSPAGAKGLMQLMDGTAAELGVTRVFDPRQNINSGTEYLRKQMDRFGDPRLALAAYNAGPGSVERHNGIPPFPETEAYVSRVMDAYASYREQIGGGKAKAISHSGR
ncbi:MAG: lytic transglycosylase domain-containing protein [candidate division Zixibacteria bacterium]|nr:lytic transglycosylase domain-containing protein [candidate division Zixibacteria bacterium]